MTIKKNFSYIDEYASGVSDRHRDAPDQDAAPTNGEQTMHGIPGYV